MLAIERMRSIVQLVRRQSSVRVVDLAHAFAVSGETIRRDLETLEKEGLVRRVHGGAVDVGQSPVRHYHERELHRRAEKQAIGRLAATLVEDGDTLILDVGTTVLAFCAHLAEKRDLTVITPSLSVAQMLKGSTDFRIVLTGGDLQDEEPYLVGHVADRMLRQFYVNRAFVSVGGISFDVGLTDFNDAEVELRKTILQRAEQVVVLADSSKLGVRAYSLIDSLDKMDILVTDARLHPEAKEQLEEYGVEVLVAPPFLDDESAADR